MGNIINMLSGIVGESFSFDSLVGATSLKINFETPAKDDHACIVCDDALDMPEDNFFCSNCVSVFSTD